MNKIIARLIFRVSFLLILVGSVNAFSASLTATVSGTTVTLNYSVSDSNAYVSEYQNVSGSSWAWVSIGGSAPTGTIVITRSPGTYQFQVTGCGQSGCGVRASTTATVTAPTPPLAPSFSATNIVTHGISLSWTQPSGAATYDVYRGATLIASRTAANSLTDPESAGLTAGTQYTYSVYAYSSGGLKSTSAGTVPVTYPSKPSDPSNFSATASGANVILSWSNVNASSYLLTRGGSGISLSVSCTSATCTATDTSAVPNNSYTYGVQACNVAGNCSANISTPISLPAIPQPSISAALQGLAISLNWNTGGAYSFRVQKNGTDIATSGSSYSDTSLASSTMYTYTIIACNVNSLCASSSTSVSVPSSLSFTPQVTGNNSLKVYVYAGNTVDTWQLQESSDNGANWRTVLAGNRTGNGLAFYDGSVLKGGTYRYQIYYGVVNGQGIGYNYTSYQTVTLVGTPPPTPPTVNTPSVSGSTLSLSWDATAAAVGGNYSVKANGGTAAFQAATSYSFANTSAGNTYTLVVLACNPTGECSSPSNPASNASVTRTGNPTISATIDPKTVVPSITLGAAVGAGQYTIQRMNADGSGATNVYVGGFTQYPSVPALPAAGSYKFQVQACKTTPYVDCSSWVQSNTVSASSPSSAPALTLSTTTSTNGLFTLSWPDIPNAKTYTITEFTNGTQTASFTQNTPNYTPSPAKTNATYAYQVYASNPVGNSSTSSATVNVAALGSWGTIASPVIDLITGVPTVSWTEVTGATQYVVQQLFNGSASGQPSKTVTALAAPNSTTFTAVSTAGSYTYQITAQAVVGTFTNSSAATSPVFALAAPASSPTSIVVPSISVASNPTISWSGGTANTTYYKIYENGSHIASTASSLTPSTSYQFSNKSTGTYTYKIASCNVAGCNAAYSPTGTMNVSVVTNVKAVLLQNTGVTTLTWDPITSANYSIQVKIDGVASGSPVTTSTPSYTFPAVTAAATYTYEVTACVTVTNCSAPLASNPVTPIQPDPPLLSSPFLSGSGYYSVTWSKSLWATHYKLFENSVLIQDTAEWSKVFAALSGKTNGTYIYQVQACFVVCSPLSNLSTTTVTLVSKTTNPANSSGTTTFNFATEAPANFTYPLTPSGVPDLGQSQFVAATQGQINVTNGTAQYSLNVDLPPAIRDLKPSLALNYSSQGGNGFMGVGWNVGGLSSITRCRTNFATEGAQVQKSNPKYSVGDRLCLDGKKLVLAASTTPADDATYWATDAKYQTEIDSFSRVEAHGSDGTNSHAYFKIFTKDGRTLTYGGETSGQQSRIRQSGQTSGLVAEWLLDKVEDSYGNNYTITYTRDIVNGTYYPDRINYIPNTIVKFEYETRAATAQVPSGYDMGALFRNPLRLKAITTYIDASSLTDETTGIKVKQYQVKYKVSATTQRELVDTLSECGWNGSAWQCARPLTFGWHAGEQGFEPVNSQAPSYCSASGGGLISEIDSVIDIDGDGYNDLIFDKNRTLAMGTPSGCFNSPGSMATGIGSGFTTAQLDPIMTMQGYAILVTYKAVDAVPTDYSTKVYLIYNISKGVQTSSSQLVASVTNAYGGPSGVIVADVNNDGLGDFSFGGVLYKQQYSATPTFVADAPYQSPYVSRDGSGSYVDLNADGMKDFLVINSNMADDTKPSTVGISYFLPGITQINIAGTVYTYQYKTLNQVFDVNVPKNNRPGAQFEAPEIVFKGGMDVVHGDLNGDGEQDYVFYRKDTTVGSPTFGQYVWMYRLSLESTIGPEVNTHQIAVGQSDVSADNRYIYAFDWDKDGRDDLIAVVPGSCTGRILLSRGESNNIVFQELRDSGGNLVPAPITGELCLDLYVPAFAKRFVGDVNNDGTTDLMRNGLSTGKMARPDLLVQVTDGFGAQTKVEYSTLVDAPNHGKPLYTPEAVKPSFPQIPVSRGMQVVKTLSFSDGKGGFNDAFYNYTGGRVDTQGRGFLGFTSIQVTDVAHSTTSITNYRLDFPFTGRVDSATTQSVNWDILISSVKNVYAVHSGNARFPYLDYSIQKNYQLSTDNPDWPLSATKVKNTYDTCGNLIDQTSNTGTGVLAGVVTGLLAHKHQFSAVNNYGTPNDCSDDFVYRSTVETSKTSTSDDFRSVVSEMTPTNSSAGSPKEVATFTAFKGTALEKTTTFNRSATGLVTGSSIVAKDIDNGTAATRSVTTSNFLHTIYPQTVTNVSSGGNLVSETRFDYRNGQANYVKTPNGLATTREFDPLGRVINEYLPDMTRHELIAFDCATVTAVVCPEISGSEPSVRAAYGVVTKVTNSSFANNTLGAPLTITYYDSLQRPVRSTTYTLNGNAINVDRVYKPEGNVSYVSEPFNTDSQGNGDSSKRTVFDDYDELGVPHTERHADGGIRSTHYDRWDNNFVLTQTVTVAKTDGSTETQTTQRSFNPLGQMDQSYDAMSVPVDYTYTSQGGLATTRVNNNLSTQVSITYDAAGNKSNMVDPDAGTIDFEYNGFGELRRQTWQKGTAYAKSMTLNYDQLGRQFSRVDQPATGNATTYEWFWNAQGQLTTEREVNNGQANRQTISYLYDELGRPSDVTTSITGLGDKIFSYRYDAYSRPSKVTYPNGLSIQHKYHANGMAVQTQDVTDVANPKVLWALGNDVDTRGSFVNQLWGNGVVTQTAFDALSGQLKTIKSGRLTTTNTMSDLKGDIQNLSFVFDTLGNLESRTTQLTNATTGLVTEDITEKFTYDGLNRLTTSDVPYGLFTRTKSYGYDIFGNLTSRISKMNGTNTNDDVGTLTYGGNGTSLHQVSSAGGLNYQYDKYGNMTQRGSETITYDVFNKPIKISNSTTTTDIKYDANHNRFYETDGTKTTYTIAGGMYEEEVSGSTTTQKSYVDGSIINVKVFNGGLLSTNTTQYLHKDHLGSVEAISDSSGNLLTRMSFSDWGNRQQSNWVTGMPVLNFPTQNGYGGHHELDKHNLVHMGGRVYDPTIGRFLSADLLVQEPNNTQSYNRYSYVMNNPTGYIDPTGYCRTGYGVNDTMMYTIAMGQVDAMHQSEITYHKDNIVWNQGNGNYQPVKNKRQQEEQDKANQVHDAMKKLIDRNSKTNGAEDNGDGGEDADNKQPLPNLALVNDSQNSKLKKLTINDLSLEAQNEINGVLKNLNNSWKGKSFTLHGAIEALDSSPLYGLTKKYGLEFWAYIDRFTHEIYQVGVGSSGDTSGSEKVVRHNQFGDAFWHDHPHGYKSNMFDRGIGFMNGDGWEFVRSENMTQGFENPMLHAAPGTTFSVEGLRGMTINTDDYQNGAWTKGTQVLTGPNWW